MRVRLLVSIVGLSLLAPAMAHAQVPANPADQPPFDGGRPYVLSVPPSGPQPPQGFRLTVRRAQAIATRAVSGDLPGRGGNVRVRTRLGSNGRNQWQIDFYEADGKDVAQVVIDDATGSVLEKWTGAKVDTKLARGYEGAVAGKVNKWWIWLPLCVLFLAPFVDPRRPLRLIHLDLVALLGFSASLFFFNKAKIELSVALVYPMLAYVFIRMLFAGLRSIERSDRLLPVARRGRLRRGLLPGPAAELRCPRRRLRPGQLPRLRALRARVPLERAMGRRAGRAGGGPRLRAAHRSRPVRTGPEAESGHRGLHPRHRPRLCLARLPVHHVHARLELQRRAGGVAGGLLPIGRDFRPRSRRGVGPGGTDQVRPAAARAAVRRRPRRSAYATAPPLCARLRGRGGPRDHSPASRRRL